MKQWKSLSPEQRENALKAFDYLLSDQWWIDLLADDPDYCEAELLAHGYDPATMTTDEKVRALDSIPPED